MGKCSQGGSDIAALRVFMANPRYGRKGLLVDCRMNKADGLLIVGGSLQPLYDTARALQAQGIGGRLELWSADKSFARLFGKIEHLAKWTVVENNIGLSLRPYTERPQSDDTADLHGDLAHRKIPPRSSTRSAVAA